MGRIVTHKNTKSVWLFNYSQFEIMDDCQEKFVCLSERDINLIWNAIENIWTIQSRVYVESTGNLYEIVDDEQWETFVQWVATMRNNLGGWTVCNDIFTSMAASLEAIANRECCQPTIGGGSAGAGLDAAPESGVSSSEEAQEGPPPDGFETWEEYFDYKCNMAHYIITQMSGDLATTILLAAGYAGVTALAGALLTAIFTPVGWAVLLGLAALAIQWFILGAEASALTSFLEENEDELACALYNGNDAASSISGYASLIDTLVPDYTLISAYGVIAEYLASQILKTIATVDSINRLYVKVAYPIPEGENCEDCNPLGPILFTCTYPEEISFNDDGYMILVAENIGGDYLLAYGFDGVKNFDVTLESGSYTPPAAVPTFMTAIKDTDATYCGLGAGSDWTSITTSFPAVPWVSPGTIQLRSGSAFSARFTPFD